MSNKRTILLPTQNILFWTLFLKEDKATCRLAFKEALFLCWEFIENRQKFDGFADSLLNHLNVHHKQLMPSMRITSSSWTVCFHYVKFSGCLKGCNLHIVQIILELIHMAKEGYGDRQDLLLWLISSFENEMQYEPGNKLDKPLAG